MFDDNFNHLDTVHERGGQTNGQPRGQVWTTAKTVLMAVKTTLTTLTFTRAPFMVSFQSEYG